MDTDAFLEHYGIKGMKWGVRRSAKELSTARSSDSKKAETAKTKVKKSGVKSLSNTELRDLNNRMNLETQYERLASQSNTKRRNKGAKVAQEILVNVGKQQAQNYLNQQVKEVFSG